MASSERQKCMLKLADLLDENNLALGQLESIAMGQPAALAAKFGTYLGETVRYYAGWCNKLPGEMQPEDGDGQYKLIRYEPMGVCAGIAAWNATLLFLCFKVSSQLV